MPADCDRTPKPSGDVPERDAARPRRMFDEAGVLAIVPYSPATLYRMVRKGQFPAPTFISPNRKIWFEDEIVAWQNALAEHDHSKRKPRTRKPPRQPAPQLRDDRKARQQTRAP